MAWRALLPSLARSLFTIPKSSREPVFLRDHPSYIPEGYHFRVDHTGNETTLVVVFHGETPLRFSFVRIVLFCDALWMDDQHTWAIRQLEPVIHSSRDHVHRTIPSDPTLPQFTVTFKAIPYNDGSVYYDLVLASAVDELRRRNSKSVRILSETKHSITPDTLSVSIAVTRTLAVDVARSRTTNHCLPTELLLEIFEVAYSCPCQWQNDLLSFAQVCRRWSQCAMKLLFSRLESSEWKKACLVHPDQSLDPWAFSRVLRETPALGLGIQHLDVDEHNGLLQCSSHDPQKKSLGLLQALITILRGTKDLQHLNLALGYSSEANVRFLMLPELPHLHSLSITRAFHGDLSYIYSPHSIDAFQLACCMTRWSGLTSLTVEDIRPGNIGMGRFCLRPPACALTRLCIRYAYLSDKDLRYLTASSADTLTQVTLDEVWGVTNDGLRGFLDSISRNVASLTILDVQSLDYSSCWREDRALDAVVDKMWCLRELNIRGDVASERMLRRRSEVFVRSRGSGVPVVRLSAQFVAGIVKHISHEWAGWDVIESCQ